MVSKRWVVTIMVLGGILSVAVLLVLKRLTHLTTMAIIGSEITFHFAFILLLTFSVPPLAQNKTARNTLRVLLLPFGLFGVAAFLAGSERTSAYSLPVFLLAIGLYCVFRPFVKRSLRRLSEEKTNQG